jgi:hypothetical protein
VDFADVTLRPIADTIPEPDETVIVTVAAGSNYTVDTSGSRATITIEDDDVPPPAVSSLQPASITAGGEPFTLTVRGSNFLGGTVILWNQTPLTTEFVSSSQLAAAVNASLIAAPSTVQISTRFENLTSNSISFNITAPIIPTLTLAGPPPPAVPTENAVVSIQLESPPPMSIQGSLALGFNPAVGVPGLPAGYRDPALQFLSGGTTLDFSVPARSTTVTLPRNGSIQQGTVAGDIIVSVTRLSANGVDVIAQAPPNRAVTIPKLAPVIIPNSVRIVAVNATSFDVDLTAYSTPRDLTGATFTFEAGGGIDGTSSFTVDLRPSTGQWYASAQSLPFGSLLRLRVRFTAEGDTNSLQRVTVTLANSTGISLPATGGR